MPKQNNQKGREERLEEEGLFIGGGKLEVETGKEKEIVYDGYGEYKVVDPRRLYLGKSYADWTTDWFNWFISADADKRNSGPVVFLRSRGLPNSITGANTSDVPGTVPGTGNSPDSFGADTGYRAIYVNDPNIRIGSDRLQIFQDQFVFVPIIIAYEFASIEPYIDWGWMQDFTGLTIDYGDNPPEPSQLTINNKDIELGLGMPNFRITTPIFPAVVPDTQYGRSIKDFLEDRPIAPGIYPALVEGYFVMLKFEVGTYWVHSWASAPRERSGPYFSELLYQIEVDERPKRDQHKGLVTQGKRRKRDPHEGVLPRVLETTMRPSRNEGVLSRTLYEKMKTGELTQPEINRFQRFFSSSLKKDI
ncbi:MAG TPA: hypothetical protein VIP70_05655 [Nitrososphaeraceae archaeon]